MPQEALFRYYDLDDIAKEHALSLWQGAASPPYVPGLWEEAYRERVRDLSSFLDETLASCGVEVETSRTWGSIYYDLRFRRVDPDRFDETRRMPLGPNSDCDEVACAYNELLDAHAASMAYARLALEAHERYLDLLPWDARDLLWDDADKAYRAIDTYANEALREFARRVVDIDESIAESCMSVEFFEDVYVPDHLFTEGGDPVDMSERELVEQGGSHGCAARAPRAL